MEIIEMCDVRRTDADSDRSDMASTSGCSDSFYFDDGTEVPREVLELGLHAEVNMFELSAQGQLQALNQARARHAAQQNQKAWFLTPVLGKTATWVSRQHTPFGNPRACMLLISSPADSHMCLDADSKQSRGGENDLQGGDRGGRWWTRPRWRVQRVRAPEEATCPG
jgi:hypothetical protein